MLATRSAGKLRELHAMLASAGLVGETLEELGIAEDPREAEIEIYDTFEENARAKARWFSALLPGRLVFAEDSGLEVDALGGAPGVRSKRWATSDARDASAVRGASTPSGAALDDANNRALIAALRAHPSASARRARYRCVAVLVEGDRSWVGEGRAEGVITTAARGAGGFGYDPWFESLELGRTFGEVSAEEKARVSHRARAVTAVLAAYAARR